MGGSKKSALAPAGAALTQAGNIVELFMDVVRATFRRPFQFREFIEQAWFIASVTILPTALVAIPFGAVVSLQTGSLIKQLGAESFTGAASVLAVIQQGSPIVTALLIAGAAGSAVTADLGSRTIREEIDAMRVLGIDPVHRLVVPRVLAMILVAVLLNGLVSVVGITGGYFFQFGMCPVVDKMETVLEVKNLYKMLQTILLTNKKKDIKNIYSLKKKLKLLSRVWDKYEI